MCGIANLQQIENEIKRRANRRPVPWWEKAIMLVCLAMVMWFCAGPVYAWVDGIVALQAQISYAKF